MNNKKSIKDQARIYLSKYEEYAQYYIQALEELQVGLWFWDVENNVTNVNEQWAHNLGYTKQELGETCLETCRTLIHPDDYELMMTNIDACLDKKQDSYRITVRMLHKDGHYVHLQIYGNVIKKG